MDRTWPGINNFLEERLKAMEVFTVGAKQGTAVDKLAEAALKEVMGCVRRQMDEMEYLREDCSVGTETVQKMMYSLLTNSGCESRQSNLDHRVKFSGGSTPLQTISNKEVVVGNRYPISQELSQASGTEQRKEFQWARNSSEAKEALALKENLISLAASVDRAAYEAREEKKEKVSKGLSLLDQCKLHGGLVSASSFGLLDKLNEKELLLETRYLCCTVAPAIKERHQVIYSDGKKNIPVLPITSLRENIKTVIIPVFAPVANIDILVEKMSDDSS